MWRRRPRPAYCRACDGVYAGGPVRGRPVRPLLQPPSVGWQLRQSRCASAHRHQASQVPLGEPGPSTGWNGSQTASVGTLRVGLVRVRWTWVNVSCLRNRGFHYLSPMLRKTGTCVRRFRELWPVVYELSPCNPKASPYATGWPAPSTTIQGKPTSLAANATA